MKTAVLSVLKNTLGTEQNDLTAPLMELFGDAFSPLWGDVLASIEADTGVVLNADDVPPNLTVGGLIAKLEQKARLPAA